MRVVANDNTYKHDMSSLVTLARDSAKVREEAESVEMGQLHRHREEEVKDKEEHFFSVVAVFLNKILRLTK